MEDMYAQRGLKMSIALKAGTLKKKAETVESILEEKQLEMNTGH